MGRLVLTFFTTKAQRNIQKEDTNFLFVAIAKLCPQQSSRKYVTISLGPLRVTLRTLCSLSSPQGTQGTQGTQETQETQEFCRQHREFIT